MTEPQQPPAGWYPDPQDAQQQRYWDGSAWTGHTAPSATTMAAPTGMAPMGSALPTGAPTWAMPANGMPGSPKKAWFKRKVFIIPAAIVVVLIVLIAIGVAVSNGGDHSNALERSIRSDGQRQLQAGISANNPGATLAITTVHCVETGNSQAYTCQIHGTITNNGETQRFAQDAAGTCDSDSSCLWHTTDAIHPDNS